MSTIAIDIRDDNSSLEANFCFEISSFLQSSANNTIVFLANEGQNTKAISSTAIVISLPLNKKQASTKLKEAFKNKKIDHFLTQRDFKATTWLKSYQFSFYLNKLSDLEFKNPLKKAFYTKQLAKARHIFLPSLQVQETLLSLYPNLSVSKLKIVPYAFEQFSAFPLQSCQTLPYLLSDLSRTNPLNIITILRAFNLKKDIIPYHLLILADPPKSPLARKKYYSLEKEWKDFIQSRSLKQRVHFFHNVQPKLKQAYYQNATLFLDASIQSNSAQTTLNALAAALPVLSSQKNSLPNPLQSCVIEFIEFDHQDLAEKMLYLLQNHEDREIYSQSAKKLSQKYTWSNSSRLIFDYLTQC